MSDVLEGEGYVESTSLWLLGDFEGALQTLQRTGAEASVDGKVRWE
jgi:hypothetical protein